jgi:putative transcriptional regulator
MRNPDRGAMLGLILLLPLAAAAQVDVDLAPGRILIADKDLHDPNFEHTVILLLSYDEDEGAGGVILNRPSETPVSQALKEYPEARGNSDLAYQGGPVQTKRVLALLHAKTKLEDAGELVPGVYSVGTTKLLRKALADKMDIRVFAGYAGWGAGQLEAEVDAGAWHVERGVAATVFDDDPESLWPRLTRKLDTQIARSKLNYDHAPSPAPRTGSLSSSGILRQVSATGIATTGINRGSNGTAGATAQ